MIIEGIKLTVIGMVVVYVFLVLMVMMIHLFSKLLKSITEEEAALLDFQSRKKKKPSPAYDNKKITAIISAAIAAHRARFHQRT